MGIASLPRLDTSRKSTDCPCIFFVWMLAPFCWRYRSMTPWSPFCMNTTLNHTSGMPTEFVKSTFIFWDVGVEVAARLGLD